MTAGGKKIARRMNTLTLRLIFHNIIIIIFIFMNTLTLRLISKDTCGLNSIFILGFFSRCLSLYWDCEEDEHLNRLISHIKYWFIKFNIYIGLLFKIFINPYIEILTCEYFNSLDVYMCVFWYLDVSILIFWEIKMILNPCGKQEIFGGHLWGKVVHIAAAAAAASSLSIFTINFWQMRPAVDPTSCDVTVE